MSETRMECKYVDGSINIKIEGYFEISMLYLLILLAQRCSEQGAKAVIVDVPDNFTISDEVKRLKGKYLERLPNDTEMVIIGHRENAEDLGNVLAKHIIALNIKETIDSLCE